MLMIYYSRSLVSPKMIPNELKGTYQWRRKEIDMIKELYSRNPEKYHIRSVYSNLPGSDKSKEYYLKRIKEFFTNSTQPGGKL